MQRYAAITGWGMAVPRRVVTNADLTRIVDTTDEWIRSRTGIAQRHLAEPDEPTSVLALAAARQAIAGAAIDPATIDLVILATCTPDLLFPATACKLQADLGIPRAGAFDLVAACSGFVYGLSVATRLIQSGAHENVLLVAADLFSHILNWQDRSTCVLFGDGAGAVVLQASSEPYGMLSSVLRSAGEYEHHMAIAAGGTRQPLTAEGRAAGAHYFTMNGREVYRHAIREMTAASEEAVATAGLTIDAIDVMIPHQANIRIIDGIAIRLGFPRERVFVNVERYGNTSAASVPLALYEAAEAGWLHRGSTILLSAFGGGFTWAAAVVRWGVPAHLASAVGGS